MARSNAQKTGKSPAPSPDSRLQYRGVLITALIGLVAVLISSSVTYLSTRATSSTHRVGASSPGIQPTRLGRIKTPGPGVPVDQVVNLSGAVYNLKPDQLVWTFNQPLGSSYFPDSGPCPVSGNTWQCNGIYIGNDGAAGIGVYRIWAVVVNDQDAFNIVNELRCVSTKEDPCPSINVLPGTDITKAQEVTVDRTR
jgi:hypothetical protein